MDHLTVLHICVQTTVGTEEAERKAAGFVRHEQSNAVVYTHAFDAGRLHVTRSVRFEHLGLRSTNPELPGKGYYFGESYFVFVVLLHTERD